MAEAQTQVWRGGLTEEELALLGHSDLAEARPEVDHDELSYPATAEFRERLALGDLSW